MEWTPETVRAFRDAQKMNQQDFGEWLGYSGKGASTRISDIERGAAGISGPVARLLDCLAQKSGYSLSGASESAEDVADRLEAATAAALRALRS